MPILALAALPLLANQRIARDGVPIGRPFSQVVMLQLRLEIIICRWVCYLGGFRSGRKWKAVIC